LAAGITNIILPIFFFGGIGNFIIGRNGNGAGQIILTLSGAIVCVFACMVTCFSIVLCGDDARTVQKIIMLVLKLIVAAAVLAGIIWSIIDGAHMLECKITDSNGYMLYL
jgi:uncharacterized membrane protein YqjE